MKIVKIAITFARPFLKEFNPDLYVEDIKEAVSFASLNLRLRFHIKLSELKTMDNGTWYVEMFIPDDIKIDNYGYRLRGISVYLLKEWPEKYNPLKVGNRLLYYEMIES